MASGQIAVTPANPVVQEGASVQFSASSQVRWSMAAGSRGTIDPGGYYHAPAAVPVQQQTGGCQLLPNNHVFNTRIDKLPVHPMSSTWINQGIDENGGRVLKYDNPFGLNQVNNATPLLPMTFLYTPEHNANFPLIAGLPGPFVESGLFIPFNGNADRHIISVNTDTCQSYDMYNLYPAGSLAYYGCPLCTSQSGVTYGLSEALPSSGTDAAGMPLQPLAMRLDEILKGSINHAVRFTRVHPDQAFMWPATSSAGYGYAAGRMPMGARLRLAASVDISKFSPVAQILLTQLKQYGMILADAGTNWQIQTMADVGADPAVAAAFVELYAVTAASFEVVDESSLMLSPTSGETPLNREAVVATDVNNPGNTVQTSVVLQGVTVGVPHSSETIQSGVSKQLSATVHGTASTGVIWTLSPAVGSLSSSGLYTPPNVNSPQSTVATATSVVDPKATATILINVLPAGPIHMIVNPSAGNVPRTGTAYGPDSQGNLWWKDMGSDQIPTVSDNWWPQIWPSLPDIGLYFSSGYTLSDWTHRFTVPNGTYKITVKMALSAPVPATYSERFYLESQGQITNSTFDLRTASGNLARVPVDVDIPAVVTDNNLYFTLRFVLNAISDPTTNWPPQMCAYQIVQVGGPAAPTPAPSSATATFVGADSTTRGNWQSVYGNDGYNVFGDKSSNPSYAVSSGSGEYSYTWVSSTTDVRALQKASNPSDRIAAAWYSGTSFAIDFNPADLSTHQVALYLVDWDTNNRQERVDVIDPSGNVLNTQTLTNFHNGVYLVWNVTGHVLLRLTNAGVNAVASGIFFGGAVTAPVTAPVTPPSPQPPVPAPAPVAQATVAFVKTDTATQGNWRAVYGLDGYDLAGDFAANPSYVSPIVAAPTYTWSAGTSDTRALQAASNPSSRIAAGWYSDTSFTIDLNPADQLSHQVAIYCLDWDWASRQQKIDLLDVNGNLLDTRSLTGFSGGVYLVWNVTGHVKVRVSNLGGNNTVVSGLFFGGPLTVAPLASSPVTFAYKDSTTQGNWFGVYGVDGYNLAGDGSQDPWYASPAVAGASVYTWSSNSPDPRALRRTSNLARRIAAAWDSTGTFTIGLNIIDQRVHQVALYCVDWDSSGRMETIDVLDANGNVVNTQTLNGNFQNGVYLVWNVVGNVTFRIRNQGTPFAAVSGLFLN